MIIAALVAGWWLFRCRYLLLEMARTVISTIADFLRKLLDLRPAWRPAKRLEPEAPRPNIRPLSEYKNPFFAGEQHRMAPSDIILYTYDFALAWAREHGVELHPEQTARVLPGHGGPLARTGRGVPATVLPLRPRRLRPESARPLRPGAVKGTMAAIVEQWIIENG
jgi:hypothetical protein